MSTPRPHGWAWWHAVILVDLALVGFVAVSPWLPDGLAADILRGALSLDLEMNVATWWSALILFLSAALMYEQAAAPGEASPLAWTLLAVLGAGMAYDEVASVHERIGLHGWKPLLPIGALCGLALVYALLTLARQGRWHVVGLLAAGYLCLASAGVQEAVAQRWEWGTDALRLVCEEGMELVGDLLVLAGAVSARRVGGRGVFAILPRPERLPYLPALVTLGLVANVLVSIFWTATLQDLGSRGNPAVWYPNAVYALLASGAAWAAAAPGATRVRARRVLAGLLAVCSLGMVYNLVTLAPYIDAVLPREAFEGFYPTYSFLIVPVALAALAAGVLAERPGRTLAGLGMMVALLLVYRRVPDWHVVAATPSLVAWTWSWVLRPARPPS